MMGNGRPDPQGCWRNREHPMFTTPCLLLRPFEYDTSAKYPIVVALPYGRYEDPAANLLSSEAYRKRYPSFLFVPYCPAGKGWGGVPNTPSLDTLVFDALLSLEQELPGIDPGRRYVMGTSRGGYGTWHFICTRPDLFAAAIPISGGTNPEMASRITEMAIWAFHGEEDLNVPVYHSRNMIKAIRQSGGEPKYTEFAGEGHGIWYFVKNTPGLWDWLFSQQQRK